MSRSLSRRTALRGSVAASLSLAAGVASAAVEGKFPSTRSRSAEVLSANDRRLVELADAYEALDRRCDEHTALHRHDHTPATDDEFDVLASGFNPLEEECAATPADSLVGVIAKARMFQAPTARAFNDDDHVSSLADDVWRLYKAGRLAHA